MIYNKNLGSALIIIVSTIIFTICFAIIKFENNINYYVDKTLKNINTNGDIRIEIGEKPKVSVYPWLGATLKEVLVYDKKSKSKIKIKEVNFKVNPTELITDNILVVAIRLDSINTNIDELKKVIPSLLKVNLPYKISIDDGLDIEIKNTLLSVKLKNNSIKMDNTNAKIFGFNTRKPFTISLDTNLIGLGLNSKVNLKTLVSLEEEMISFRNNHIKVEQKLSNGKVWISVDNNIYVDNSKKEILINDMNGFFNNSQVIGRLRFDMEKNYWSGVLNLLPSSLNRFIFDIDNKTSLIDMNEAHSLTATLKLANNKALLSCDINDTSIKSEANLDINNGGINIKSNIDTVSLDENIFKILDNFSLPNNVHKLKANFLIKDIKFLGATLKGNKFDMDIKPGKLSVSGNIDNIYKGTAKINLIKEKNNVTVNSDLSDIQIALLANDTNILKDKISGTLNLNSKINMKKLYNNLDDISADAKIKIKNGYFYGNFNPAALFAKTLNNKNQNIKITRPSSFSSINSLCEMEKGIIKCSPLDIKTHNASLKGDLNFDILRNDIFGFIYIKSIATGNTLPLRINFYGNKTNLDSYVDFGADSSNIVKILSHAK